jgi:alpha-amylase
MTDVCMYFQIHQPYRLRRYRVFDIGSGSPYWDAATNRGVLRRVAERCYLPANAILAEQIRRTGGAFRVAMSCSGVVLEQLEAAAPEVIDSFRDLVATGGVEFLGETYYHSLTSLSDLVEFANQVRMHTALIERLFGVTPRIFRNTELLYHDGLADQIAAMGFHGVLVEGADSILNGRTPNAVYAAAGDTGVRLIPRNYRLSDDVAFRFSQRSWEGWPLTAERYASWLAGVGAGSAHVFIDYETFGEHQWAETGIFDFLRHLPDECLRRGVRFVHPSDLAARDPADTLRVPYATSWADTERDASAWLGNQLQQAAFNRLNRLYGPVWATHDAGFLDTWRRLSTSDHLYYMSTKRLADAEVHSYFNPYANPYDAFIAYMNVLQDLEQRVEAAGSTAAVPDRVLEATAADRDLTQPANLEPTAVVVTAIAEPQVTSPQDARTQRPTSRVAAGSGAKGRRVNAKPTSRTRAKEPREPG